MDMEKPKSDLDEQYVLELCDNVLGITSSRQNYFDFPVGGYYDDFKIAVVYGEKQNADITNYFSKLNIRLIEYYYTDFNCDKQNNIIRDTALDKIVVRRKLTFIP